MSRCFPFPPPGYEKKPKSGEHGDLLAKEKHKGKKHKKEDKERRDKDKSKDKQKEKKERKEKHRDKKKDKDRDKERNKTPEDQRTQIHRKADEFRDSKFTEELGRRIRHEGQGATSRMVEGISATPNTGIESTGTSTAMVDKMPTNVPVTIQRNDKLTPSFHNRTEVKEISKATSGEKVHDTERRRNEYLIPQVQKRTETMGNATAMEKQRAPNDHKVSDRTSFVGRTEGVFTVNSIQRERVAGTIGSSTKRNGQAMENLQSIPRRIENAGAAPATEKGRFVFPNVIGNEQRKAEGMGVPLDKGAEKKTEGKEKSKEKKAEDDKKEEGQKDRERKEKKRKEKDKNRDKEKKKEEKKREKREHKRSKHDKLNENELKDHIPKLNHMTLAPRVENVNAAGADGTIKRKEVERNPDGPNKKRKEFEMNGFLHEPQHNGCPSKLPRTSVASFHPPVNNGRSTGFASGRSPISFGGINNTKVERDLDNNGKHINDMVDVQPSPARKSRVPPVVASSSKVAVQPSPRLKPLIPPVVDSTGNAVVQPSAAVRKSPIPPLDSKAAVQPSPLPKTPVPTDVQSNGKGAIEPSPVLKPPIPSAVDSSVKVVVQSSPVRKPPIHPVVQPTSRPPHRDTKYLSTIYTVPKMEDLSESEDLDWLFNDKKLPSTAKVEADGTPPPQVGAKGLQIESADVFALPYVIPY